ncbi:uncharacterized protein EDB91DRAFT_1087225 [Suillus paluster]|uniref:uncharacterized protein n=1 Tax=Suillus paluster TaxID=48578 RepID=UPI001B86A9BE|nr:uncharacterized protein EDB91DRAFT_1087225 [Suillus paluster]KAG1725164.1 hypothetical protein EDB91DRAFT_1087225 [Suillus paluster]
MDSHEHPIDKARRLQDERIKADWNFFVMWDQWVPTEVVADSIPSKRHALSKKYFGHEIFDMGWSTEADDLPTVGTPTGTSSAGEHFGGQTFDMCWDTEVDPAPIMSENAARPAAAGQYNLCWDDEPDPSKVDSPPIVEPATIETPTMDSRHTIGGRTGRLHQQWVMKPILTCAGEIRHRAEVMTFAPGGTTAPAMNLVNSAANTQQSSESHSTGTQAFYDMGFGRGSPDTSVVPRDGSPERHVRNHRGFAAPSNSEAGKHRRFIEYVHISAHPHCHHIDLHPTGDDLGHTSAMDGVASPRDIMHANRDLISAYRDARDRLIEAGEDVVRMQHLMNMQRQIDDPLHVLLLAMRKMGRGHSPFQ